MEFELSQQPSTTHTKKRNAALAAGREVCCQQWSVEQEKGHRQERKGNEYNTKDMRDVSLDLTQPSCPMSSEHTWEGQHLEAMMKMVLGARVFTLLPLFSRQMVLLFKATLEVILDLYLNRTQQLYMDGTHLL